MLRGTVYSGKANASSVVDLTGVPLAVVDSNLGAVEPSVAATDPTNGGFELTFPDTSPLELARSYKMRIRVGVQGDAGTFTTPSIEVIAQ